MFYKLDNHKVTELSKRLSLLLFLMSWCTSEDFHGTP